MCNIKIHKFVRASFSNPITIEATLRTNSRWFFGARKSQQFMCINILRRMELLCGEHKFAYINAVDRKLRARNFQRFFFINKTFITYMCVLLLRIHVVCTLWQML